MSLRTNTQKMAQTAYEHVRRRQGQVDGEFGSFARSFPSLIHSSGLAQAVAFAKAKAHLEYLADLAAVLVSAGHAEAASVDKLEMATRDQPVTAYLRLSRNALQAAGWLKRYVEAAAEK